MNDTEVKDLCLSLIKADTEEELIQLLTAAGYWDNRAAWRCYGDSENNWSIIGNQQSNPDAALIEKLVNSADARLMNECLVRGVDPTGPEAPQTIRQAVAQFFEESRNPQSMHAGLIAEWPNEQRREVARGITLTATGLMPRAGNPCLAISDCGEGQTPEMMPYTFLSLPDRGNKSLIPFVQGTFNMGGTGVLQFCGKHKLQLIVSRRNPKILNGNYAHQSDTQWSFTIVRREDPPGGRRTTVYTYLAPFGAEQKPRRGGVLRFSANEMPIFPEGRNPYSRTSEWGTLIKLYEYSLRTKSHILQSRDGLLRRADLLLPEVALPIRLYECRDFRGSEGSYETTLMGLSVRLQDDKAENLEEPSSSCPIVAGGEQMSATIYAFKKGKAETYRKNEGIIFTFNGQTQGHCTTDFFRRKSVGHSYLSDTILVVVNCDKLSERAREDLFMNSRDRLRNDELRAAIERQLEEMLKNHEGLRALREKRKREQSDTKLGDSKPLEDILESVLKHSPTLSALFLRGDRLSNPFKSAKAQTEEKHFSGKRYPTYFKFKGKEYGTELHRDCHINMRCRVTFETDAENDYFSRDIDRGEFSLFRVVGDSRFPVANFAGPNLRNGSATLSVELPVNCREGDTLRFVAEVTDSSCIKPFENSFVVTVKEATETRGGTVKPRPPKKGEKEGQDASSGISLPEVTEVYEKDWEKQTPPFDRYSALRIRNAGANGDNGKDGEAKAVYDFYVNMDNLYLQSELKSGGQDPAVSRTRFKTGMVLLGLALLHEDMQGKKDEDNDEEESQRTDREDEDNIEDKVEQVSRAIAPVLMPMISYLGTLELESTSGADASGEVA